MWSTLREEFPEGVDVKAKAGLKRNNKESGKSRRPSARPKLPEVFQDHIKAHQRDDSTPQKDVPILPRPPLHERNRVPTQPQRIRGASQPPLRPFQDVPLRGEVGEDGLALGEVGVEGLGGGGEKVVFGEGGVGARVVAIGGGLLLLLLGRVGGVGGRGRDPGGIGSVASALLHGGRGGRGGGY